MVVRSPICAIEGHVDHGKTSILDKIRGTTITAKESGGITQAIGASIIPIDTIQSLCGDLLKATNTNLTLPGLLFIDTPGHAAFSTLRKRGGALADIAIVVVDINDGVMPQTKEAIEILKNDKTPFIIACNKIDRINGWQSTDKCFLKNFNNQSDSVKREFDTKFYELVGQLYELGFQTDRFDRVDFTKQVATVPVSAVTGEGIPELLMVLAGMAQRFMEKQLEIDPNTPGKGTVLEVKEEKGIGKTADVIFYDGRIKVGDTLIIGNIGEAIETKVKGLFQPEPLAEMRVKSKFRPVKEAFAATGVKILAKNLDNVISGMPLISFDKTHDKKKAEFIEQIQSEIDEVMIETDGKGVTIKADSIGSLEAMIVLLREKNIPIRKALIGNVGKKDIMEGESVKNIDPLYGVVLGFNVDKDDEIEYFAKEKGVKLIVHDVIYKTIEDLEKWQEEKQKKMELERLESIVLPVKIRLMPGYVFRQSNPVVMGIEIISGKLKIGYPLMNLEGKRITYVKALQKESKSISSAKKDDQVALSMEKVTVGRQVNEGDVLFGDINEEEFRKLKELKKHLSKEDIEVLKEIATIKRKDNALWGL